MNKIKRCVVCRLRKRINGQKICKTCLDYYYQKYDAEDTDELFDNPEFKAILEIYNQEADQDDY